MNMRAIALLLFSTLALPVFAQAPEITGNARDKARVDERFRAADKDQNGALSREEARSSMPGVYRRFDEIDINKDGKVTREELEAAFSKRASAERKRFKALDINQDGLVSRDEILRHNASASSRAIDRMDADKDGKITLDELDGFIRRRYYLDLDRTIVPNALIRGKF